MYDLLTLLDLVLLYLKGGVTINMGREVNLLKKKVKKESGENFMQLLDVKLIL